MKVKLAFLLILSGIIFSNEAYCQDGKPEVIQFSGLVVSGDSLYGIPGVFVYTPKSGRGTVTNYTGYFSIALLRGDTVMVRALGFREKAFIIPDTVKQKLSVVIELKEDTTLMPEISLFPYATEKLFKEAFLALQLPETNNENMNKNLNDRIIQRMLAGTPNSAYMNHRYYMLQQTQKTDTRYMYPTLSLLNPFAWAKFIDSVKKGGLKSKDND